MTIVKIHVVTIVSLLIFAAPLYGQKTDVVILKNGDRMTCEIKGLESGVLHVSLDYVDGTIAVQWSKVERIESTRLFIVKTESGSVHRGILTTVPAAAGAPIRIEIAETPASKVDIDSEKVVIMETTSKRIWQRFNGEISFGATYAKAFHSSQYNLSSAIEYPSDRWTAQASFNSTLSANNATGAAERNQLDLSFRRLLRRRHYYVAGVMSFLQSSVQSIELQESYGGGLGKYFKRTNRATISLLGGLTLHRTKYTRSIGSLDKQNVAAAMIGAEVRLFKFKKTNFNFAATVLPSISEPGRVYSKINQSFYVKIFGDLSWNISFYGNWDTRPPFGLPGSDYGTSSGLGWTFGNR